MGRGVEVGKIGARGANSSFGAQVRQLARLTLPMAQQKV